MNARELRLGNLILDNGIITEVNPEIIATMQYGTVQGFEPIPLEPVQLKRAGFEIDYWKSVKKYIKGSDVVTFRIDNLGEYYFRSDVANFIVKYVHQLQNLYFALTGQELEFKDEQLPTTKAN